MSQQGDGVTNYEVEPAPKEMLEECGNPDLVHVWRVKPLGRREWMLCCDSADADFLIGLMKQSDAATNQFSGSPVKGGNVTDLSNQLSILEHIALNLAGDLMAWIARRLATRSQTFCTLEIRVGERPRIGPKPKSWAALAPEKFKPEAKK